MIRSRSRWKAVRRSSAASSLSRTACELLAAYADVKRINEELEYAKGIMRRLHCTIINVSNRAIEETAGMILEYVQKNKDRR